MSVAKIAAVSAVALALAACAGDLESGRGPHENTGMLLGGTGAAAGSQVGSQVGSQAGAQAGTQADTLASTQAGGSVGGHVAGAAAGAGLGALIGNRIGAAMDDEDRQRAYQAQISALDNGSPGAPVSWSNPDSGRHGTVVPGPYYEAQGKRCRSYTHTIYIDSRPQTARGTACRNPDGTWARLG
jgi:surface antigen